MGSKKQKEEERKEKPIFGSGAEMKPEPKDDRLVKCVCTVPCVWRGYRDEGDRVFVDRKLLESDPFFKGHFKPLEPLAGQETAAGADENENGEGDDADGGTENANGTGDEVGGKGGQGELGLK